MKAYSYIRFSTPEQIRGDSLRRQLEESRAYALSKGLKLDESMRDLGLSAFHGTHRKRGDLGTFLALVEAGKIEPGSVLIVENLDRLSRENVMDALNQFTNIISHDIRIVTLLDGQEYTKASITDNWAQLIISITYMARAHDESLRKSQRLSSVWKQKRLESEKPNGLKLSKVCPAWCRLSEDHTIYIPIPEVCTEVEKIYRLKLIGYGPDKIARILNQQVGWKPPKGRKKPGQVRVRNQPGGWRGSYVQKILTTRAVVGEFQPHRKVEGKRIPEGLPIHGYYPRAITDELYYEVQALIEQNSRKAGRGGGRTAKVSNLFSVIAKCGYCGDTMHYIDKGSGSKGGTYLHCERSQRKYQDPPCTAKPIRYQEFEDLFLNNMEELNITDLMPDKDEVLIRQNDVQRRLTANNQELLEADQQIANLTDTIQQTKDPRISKLLTTRLSVVFNNIERLRKDNKTYLTELDALMSEAETIRQTIDTAKEIRTLLSTATGDEYTNLRLRLRTEIRRLVESITIYPLQAEYKPVEEIEPGVYRTMESRFIDHVRIHFNGSRNKRVLYLKSVTDTGEVNLI